MYDTVWQQINNRFNPEKHVGSQILSLLVISVVTNYANSAILWLFMELLCLFETAVIVQLE